jgi:hypothetical protein
MSPQKRKSEFEDCLAVDQRRLRSMARDLRHLFGAEIAELITNNPDVIAL